MPPRNLTLGITVNLDNYENLRVEVTGEAEQPGDAARLVRFLDEVLAGLGRGDEATAARVDSYRRRVLGGVPEAGTGKAVPAPEPGESISSSSAGAGDISPFKGRLPGEKPVQGYSPTVKVSKQSPAGKETPVQPALQDQGPKQSPHGKKTPVPSPADKVLCAFPGEKAPVQHPMEEKIPVTSPGKKVPEPSPGANAAVQPPVEEKVLVTSPWEKVQGPSPPEKSVPESAPREKQVPGPSPGEKGASGPVVSSPVTGLVTPSGPHGSVALKPVPAPAAPPLQSKEAAGETGQPVAGKAEPQAPGQCEACGVMISETERKMSMLFSNRVLCRKCLRKSG
ncbi:MAG: hypothetical protein LUQ25_08870 [Methanoregulaceae archaeon]|nr:hypothetical protein [Methanoregulaceae archaeon]